MDLPRGRSQECRSDCFPEGSKTQQHRVFKVSSFGIVIVMLGKYLAEAYALDKKTMGAMFRTEPKAAHIASRSLGLRTRNGRNATRS